jgi:hypothetical protein
MSIIEDALKKAQNARSSGEGKPTLPPPFPVGAPPRRNGGRGTGIKWAIFLAIAAAAGASGWWGLDVYQESLRQQAARRHEAIPMKLTDVGAEGDVAAPVPVDENTESTETTGTTEAPPVAETNETTVVAETAVATDDDDRPSPFTPDLAAAPAPLKERLAEEAADFVGDGWSVYKTDGIEAAVDRWTAGLQGASPKRIVFIISAYSLLDAAHRKLEETGRENDAFVVEGRYAGKRSYYLLSLPPAADMFAVQERIMKQVNLPVLKGNRAGDLRRRLGLGKVGDEKVAETTAPLVELVVTESEPVVSDDMGAAGSSDGRRNVDSAAASAVARRAAVERKLANAPEKGVEEARRLIYRGEYASAIERLQPLFAQAPDNGEPYLLMGTAHLGAGNLDAAEEFLNQGIAVDGARSSLWVQLALVAQQRGTNARALQYLAEARRLSPESPDVWLNIGYSSDMLGDYKSAANAYRTFLRYSEGKGEYVNLRVQTLRRLGALGM